MDDNNISLLGLTMAGDNHNIRFTLADSSWSHLRESLDEAHNHPDPVNLSRLIVLGWKNASKPVIWSTEEESRLESLLRDQGFNPRLLEANSSHLLPLKQNLYEESES